MIQNPAPTAPAHSEQTRAASAKFVVAGGFGVGKTTFVGAVSEIPPLRTEETMTQAAAGSDDSSLVGTKSGTTVAMDFGRLNIDSDLVLYLFGTPGQHRFAFMWDNICTGTLGAVILVDLRRLSDSFAPIDYFEERRIPFVLAVNRFPDSPEANEDEVRQALALKPHIPVTWVDAREKEDVKATVLTLIDYLLTRVRKPTKMRRSDLGNQ